MVKSTIIKSWKQKSGTLTQHPEYIKFWEEDTTGNKKTKVRYICGGVKGIIKKKKVQK